MAFKKIPLTIDTMIRNPVPIEGINQEDNVELNIVVTENKTPKDLSSQTIKVYVRRIDGTLVEQTDQITPTNVSKGEVTVKLKNSAFNKEGYALFQLDVSDSSGRITSSYATFKIGKGLVSGEAIANTNEIEALKKIEEYIKKANQELETFKQTVAEINENEATRQENEVVRVKGEASRNEAEKLRVAAETGRVAAETKREEGFNKFEGKINANTEELKNARSATTGEKFNTLDERIDCEVDRLNKKIEVSFLQQEDKESHVIENSIEGMTTNMVIKGRTLQNLFISENVSLIDGISCSNGVFDWNLRTENNLMNYKKMQVEDGVKYTIICNVIENTLSPMTGKTVRLIRPESYGCEVFLPEGFTTGIFKISFTTNKNNAGRWDDDYSNIYMIGATGRIKFSLMVIKGDVKFTPTHFEGIKSFGEQEDKISILSHGKNLFNVNNSKQGLLNVNTGILFETNTSNTSDYIKVEKGKNYIINGEGGEIRGYYGVLYDCSKRYVAQKTFSKNTPFTFEQDGYFRFSYASEEDGLPATNIIFEEGTQVSAYEPYKEDKKDILLSSLGFDEGLRGIKNITDELNSIRSVAIKRIGKREYREGDLLLDNVITDKTNTYYVLDEPIETPLDENINLKTFGEKTYVSFENAISGTSSFKAPVNAAATISRLNREKRALEEENKNLRQDFESTTLKLTDSDLELVKQNVDMDFRLMEVEFALDIPQSTLSSNINFKKKGE